MRRAAITLLALAITAGGLSWASTRPHGAEGSPPGRSQPITFEENVGQTDRRVRFLARAPGYTAYLTTRGPVIALHGRDTEATVRMTLAGGDPEARIVGLDRRRSTVNYWRIRGRHRRIGQVHVYGRVRQDDVRPGIDVVYHGGPGGLEYDFVVAPGADPESAAVDFHGVDRVHLDDRGELVLETSAGELRQPRPFVYQDIGGQRRRIAASYVIRGSRRVGVRLARYDRSRPLVIDPVLVSSTYLGGSDDEGDGLYGAVFGVAADAAGNTYVTGTTRSADFPTTGGRDRTRGGTQDTFVTKLSSTGTLLWSTYLGGPCEDIGRAIAVDGTGNVFITGRADSGVCLDAVSTGVLVAKLSPSGSPAYSFSFGASMADTSVGQAIAVRGGRAYVTGLGSLSSRGFPTTPGAFRRNDCGAYGADGFVAVVNAAGTGLEASTYLCGDSHESPNGLALDDAGNVYVSGSTESHDFPTVRAFQPTHRGGPVATTGFVTKLRPDLSGLVYSTYLGGTTGDIATGISVDRTGSAYVTGGTASDDFPTTPGTIQPRPGNRFCLEELCSDAFVTKLAPGGSTLAYSTYLFGEGDDMGQDIAIDATGSAYVVGGTASLYFPVARSFQWTNRGRGDAFVTKLSPDARTIVYSSFLGGARRAGSSAITEGADHAVGVAVDGTGQAVVAGYTMSLNFPTTAGAFQRAPGGGECFFGDPCGDAFVTRISAGGPGVVPARRVTATPTGVRPGGTLTVAWAGRTAPTTRDQIGLYPLGSLDEPVATRSTGGTANGTRSLTVPAALPSGTYEVRLVTRGVTTVSVLARSAPVTVTR